MATTNRHLIDADRIDFLKRKIDAGVVITLAHVNQRYQLELDEINYPVRVVIGPAGMGLRGAIDVAIEDQAKRDAERTCVIMGDSLQHIAALRWLKTV